MKVSLYAKPLARRRASGLTYLLFAAEVDLPDVPLR